MTHENRAVVASTVDGLGRNGQSEKQYVGRNLHDVIELSKVLKRYDY